MDRNISHYIIFKNINVAFFRGFFKHNLIENENTMNRTGMIVTFKMKRCA